MLSCFMFLKKYFSDTFIQIYLPSFSQTPWVVEGDLEFVFPDPPSFLSVELELQECATMFSLCDVGNCAGLHA